MSYLDALPPLNARQRIAFADLQPCLMELPLRMHVPITGYILWGIRTGDFLYALLSNDLMLAVGRADDDNLPRLRQWCMLLYNGAPAGCFGSIGDVEGWISRHGLADADQVNALGWSEAVEPEARVPA